MKFTRVDPPRQFAVGEGSIILKDCPVSAWSRAQTVRSREPSDQYTFYAFVVVSDG